MVGSVVMSRRFYAIEAAVDERRTEGLPAAVTELRAEYRRAELAMQQSQEQLTEVGSRG